MQHMFLKFKQSYKYSLRVAEETKVADNQTAI